MSRDQHRENAALRARLRDTETRLRLLAAAVLTGDQGAEALARLLLGGTLEADGVSQVPPSSELGEPVARIPQE
jgi:hypothetical protein